MMWTLYAAIHRFTVQHKHYRLWLARGVWLCVLSLGAWFAPASAALLIITTLNMIVVMRVNARTVPTHGAQSITTQRSGQRSNAGKACLRRTAQGGILPRASHRLTAAWIHAGLVRTAKRDMLQRNHVVAKRTTRY